jgi:hypothetical protein
VPKQYTQNEKEHGCSSSLGRNCIKEIKNMEVNNTEINNIDNYVINKKYLRQWF